MLTDLSPRRRRRLVAACGAALLVCAAGGTTLAAAMPAQTPRTCGLGTLKGRYHFAADGWLTTASGRTPLSYAGFEEFDGAGHIKGTIRVSVGGNVAPIERYDAAYTLGSDCVASQTGVIAGEMTHWDLYPSPKGDRFTFIRTDPGTVTSGVEHRVG
ncbi:hypothetical protein [Streptomyces sp. SID8352]|uniref:hypothetical protein n=1 Tax=Streptomyces sp. SID8352 TaxID=2690338 RepID=UPI001369DECB|nr:hypothetical protein [Streptomyces sp. SID8352]MYU22628.1 hypothetical protein [Streptomyces sp. SID8352]